MKRQDGYYWVWSGKRHEIARLEYGGWYVAGSQLCFPENYFSAIDETPIVRNTLLDRFTDRHTRIDEMIRNALGHSVCALIDSMSLDDSKVWLADNGYKLVQEPGRVALRHNDVTIGEVLV